MHPHRTTDANYRGRPGCRSGSRRHHSYDPRLGFSNSMVRQDQGFTHSFRFQLIAQELGIVPPCEPRRSRGPAEILMECRFVRRPQRSLRLRARRQPCRQIHPARCQSPGGLLALVAGTSTNPSDILISRQSERRTSAFRRPENAQIASAGIARVGQFDRKRREFLRRPNGDFTRTRFPLLEPIQKVAILGKPTVTF